LLCLIALFCPAGYLLSLQHPTFIEREKKTHGAFILVFCAEHTFVLLLEQQGLYSMEV
jgi:hypothetical protein